jgi:hypothetical protein
VFSPHECQKEKKKKKQSTESKVVSLKKTKATTKPIKTKTKQKE